MKRIFYTDCAIPASTRTAKKEEILKEKADDKYLQGKKAKLSLGLVNQGP
jgi:hypothetical protein